MASLLEEKDNEIDEQKERLDVLTERISVNESTTVDERLQGVEKEVSFYISLRYSTRICHM